VIDHVVVEGFGSRGFLVTGGTRVGILLWRVGGYHPADIGMMFRVCDQDRLMRVDPNANLRFHGRLLH